MLLVGLAVARWAVIAERPRRQGAAPIGPRSQSEAAIPPALQGPLTNRADATTNDDAAGVKQSEPQGDEAPLPEGTLLVEVSWPDDEAGRSAKVRLFPQDAAMREAVTDAKGLARFEHVPAGQVGFDAYAEPYFYGIDGGHLEPGQGTRAFVCLVAGVHIRGHVRSSADGAPVVGAEVFVDRRFTARTDSRGEYGLPFALVNPKDIWENNTLKVRAAGFALAEVTLPDGSDEHEVRLDLTLLPGGTVRGTVRAPDGTPVAGAEVAAFPQEDPPQEGFVVWRQRYTAYSDETGRYDLHGLPLGGVFRVVARRRGFARSASVRDIALSASSPTTEALLVLRPPSTLVAHVRTPHASVLLDPDEHEHAWRTAGDDGTVRFDDLAAGSYVLRAEAPEWLPAREDVRVDEGAIVERTLRLTHGEAVDGVVLDDRGKPLPEATVYARDGENPDLDPRSATTAWDGSFRIQGLAPHRHTLSAERRFHEPLPGRAEVTPPAQGVRLRVTRPGILRLRPEVPSGAVAPDRVLVTWKGEGVTFTRSMDPSEDGFTYPLPPGRHECRFEPDAFAPFRAVVDLSPGEETVLPVRLDEGRTLSGRVVDDQGKAIVTASVDLERERFAVRTAVTADGRFTFSHLAREAQWMAVSAPDYVSETIETAADEATIVLHRGGVVRGRVIDAAGRGLSDILVYLFETSRPDDRSSWGYEDASEIGAYEIRVRPGHYQVELWRRDAWTPVTEVDVAEGATITLDLRAP